MSQTDKHETETPGTGGDAPIGVYYVEANELVLEPEDRTYHRRVLWTEDGWSPSSNGEMVEEAPDEKTLEAFIGVYAGRNYLVTPPEEVPGTVVEEPPRFSISDLELDVPVADE